MWRLLLLMAAGCACELEDETMTTAQAKQIIAPNWGRTARFIDTAANAGNPAVAQQMARVTLDKPQDIVIYLGPSRATFDFGAAGAPQFSPEHYAVNWGTGGAAFGIVDLRTAVRGTALHVTAERIEVQCKHVVSLFAGTYEAQASIALGRTKSAYVGSSQASVNPITAEPGVVAPQWSTHVQYTGDETPLATKFIRQMSENGNVVSAAPLSDYIARQVPLHELAVFIEAYSSIGGPTGWVSLNDIRFTLEF